MAMPFVEIIEMEYDDLTTEQKADIQRYDTYLRGVLSSLLGVFKQASPEQWAAFSAMSVDPVLATLDDSAIVPNSTGLAGAKDLTAAEFKQLQVMSRGLVKLAQDNLPLVVKAIGINGSK